MIDRNSSSNPVFNEAYSRFISTLSAEERIRFSPCASPDDFLEAVKKLDILAKKGRKSQTGAVLSRISSFSERLRPYFEALTIVTQAGSDYAALVWGALRFILEVMRPVLFL